MSEPSDSVSDKSIPKCNTHANTRAEKQPYKGNRGAKYSYRGRGGNRGKPDNADRNGRADSTDKFDKPNRGGRGSRSRGGRGGKASEATEWRPKKSEGSYQKKAEGSHQKRAEGSRYKKAEGSHQKREEGSHNKKAEGAYRKRAEESNQKNRKKNKKARKPASFYTPYITKEEFEQGLKEEKYIVGPLSVWRLPYRTFVQLEGCKDIMVTGYKNINRAMHGDIVAVEIIPKPESEKKHEKARKEANEESDEELSEECTEESEADLSIEEDEEDTEEEEEEEEQEERRYGKVVYIVEQNRATTFLGIVEGNLFKPLSDKFPWMQMKELKGKSIKYDEQFVTVTMRTWKEGFMRPSCIVKSVEGNIDKFETQYAALKIKNNINHAEDFDEKLLEGLPLSGWTIPQEEIANRRDLRKELIFSIDPPTAKDLDDALSCVRLPNGNFQVGVHIADVSYFVTENSPLDLEARDRATSVYFVTENVPMLPRILCDELCSLQGGVDRLAFSVIWELTPEGKKVSEEFTKSIICTAGQLDYATAQHMIKHPDEFEGTDYEACSVAVGYLNSIAKNISASRYENGSISLDSAEIHFDFDDEDNIIGVHPYERYDSHFLVEEFMLLANIAVAEKLHSSMREGALLRWHPSPDAEKLKLFAKQCESLGLKVDCSNSQTLHESIQAIAKDYNGITMEAILYLASQPMQSALYCATAVDAQENAYHHYALNFPLYTHFTSPIRRYADLIVHRQLSKILNNERQTMSADVVQKICTTCNQRKRDADYASRDCTRLYLNKYLRTRRFIESGIVVDVTKDSTTVLVPDYDIRCQIYFDKEDYKLQYKKSTAELVVTFLEDEDELPEKDLPKVSLKLLKVVDVELLYTSQNYCQTIGLKLAKPGERALLKSNLEK